MNAPSLLEYGRARHLFVAAAAFGLAACAQVPSVAVDVQPGGAPYAGLAIGDDEGAGALVTDVMAGPGALAGLRRADRIVAVRDESVGSARLLEILQTSMPGATLPLEVVRDGQRVHIDLVMGDLDQWSAPSRYPSRVAHVLSERREDTWLGDIGARIDDAAPELIPVKLRIDRMLGEVASEPLGYNRLPISRQALRDPGTLVAWDRRLALVLNAPDPRPALVPVLCEVLSVACPSLVRLEEAPRTLDEFSAGIANANARVRAALPADRKQMFADAKTLLWTTATRRTLLDRPNSLAGIRAMRYSMRIDSAQLLDAFDRLLDNAMRAPGAFDRARRRMPAALAAMVEGEVLDFVRIDEGYVVVGGKGPNTYRMDRLYAVIDLGGDDRYAWGEGVPMETGTVIDLGGNDRYEAVAGGPGAGWLGAAVLFDLDGDDVYSAALGGCGAGVYGFGLLFDASGNDSYRCEAWSAGAGLYGAGVLIDAGVGADAYLSHSLSQGVGGPAGAGLLVDAGGNDLYRANGPVPSAYGTPAVYMSFSQGIGFGIRPYDHGGAGALLDFGGNDRYEGGEFSQGGGYFYGVGVLHDASGDDFYYGNRYAQGFACHQAAGLLTDLSGDDTYWAMAAAAQGAAWDQSVGMLYDGAGNDSYRADSLAQGAAAEQARAWLFDASGNDRYSATAASAQGAAADNSYHFRGDDPAVSLGMLLDAGGEDRYSSGLANGESRIRFAPDNPNKGDGNAGLAIDLSP